MYDEGERVTFVVTMFLVKNPNLNVLLGLSPVRVSISVNLFIPDDLINHSAFRNISQNFRSWALGATEHPKIDISKINKANSGSETFTQEEKNVVGEFLKSIKTELRM